MKRRIYIDVREEMEMEKKGNEIEKVENRMNV